MRPHNRSIQDTDRIPGHQRPGPESRMIRQARLVQTGQLAILGLQRHPGEQVAAGRVDDVCICHTEVRWGGVSQRVKERKKERHWHSLTDKGKRTRWRLYPRLGPDVKLGIDGV
jgi:hypothetical protein